MAYLHRVQPDEPNELSYVNSAGSDIQVGDCVIIYQAQTLTIRGAFILKANGLVQTHTNPSQVSIRDCYESLSFIAHVGKDTSRMFKKKNRKISQEDANVILERLQKTDPVV
jgi:hypothetical protein